MNYTLYKIWVTDISEIKEEVAVRRNMETIRELMFEISKGVDTLEYDSTDEGDCIYIYHIELLEQAGYIKVKNMFKYMDRTVCVDKPRLTWEGNNYFDNISNDKVWEKTKNELISKGLGLTDVPFEIVKEIAIINIKKLIGIDFT